MIIPLMLRAMEIRPYLLFVTASIFILQHMKANTVTYKLQHFAGSDRNICFTQKLHDQWDKKLYDDGHRYT